MSCLRLVSVAVAVGLSAQAQAGGLPDLRAVIDDTTFLPTAVARNATVAAGDVAEGCAGATTGRTLVHFTLSTFNEGTADLVLGNPGCPDCSDAEPGVCTNELFECSPLDGHNHPHFSKYALYELLPSADAEAAATGHKQGFCLEDTICDNKVYDCFNQGLSVGCQDAYPGYVLGCQYVDATGIPGGRYILRASVNYERILEESNYENNVAERVVEICEGVKRPKVRFRRDKRTGLIRWRSWSRIFTRGPFVDVNPLRDGAAFRLLRAGKALTDVVLPGGKPGGPAHCGPEDGWQKTENSPPTFTYQNESGFLDAACSVPAEGLRTLRISVTRTGRGADTKVRFGVYGTGQTIPEDFPGGFRVHVMAGVGDDVGPCSQGAANCRSNGYCKGDSASGAFVGTESPSGAFVE